MPSIFFGRPQFVEGLIPPDIEKAFVSQNLNRDDTDEYITYYNADIGGSTWETKFREAEFFE